MGNEVGDWGERLADLGDNLQKQGLAEIQTAVGLFAKESVDDAVRRTPARKGSLADAEMSGWPRAIRARYDAQGDVLVVKPQGRSTGPMRVLEDGRKAYSAGDFRIRGVSKVRANGFRTVRSAQVNGKVGATKGKGTWTNAVRDIRADYMDVAAKAMSKILMRYYGR